MLRVAMKKRTSGKGLYQSWIHRVMLVRNFPCSGKQMCWWDIRVLLNDEVTILNWCDKHGEWSTAHFACVTLLMLKSENSWNFISNLLISAESLGICAQKFAISFQKSLASICRRTDFAVKKVF